MPEPLKKLNLGCNKNIRKGYTNLDILPFKGVNVQHDLNKFPYPFEDKYFYIFYSITVLQHIINEKE